MVVLFLLCIAIATASIVIFCKKRKDKMDAERKASVSPLVKKKGAKDISNSFVESLDDPDKSEPYKDLHSV